MIIAARLEQLNKELGTRFLVSESIQNHINQDEYDMTTAGVFHLKGIEEDMLVYEVKTQITKSLFK